MTIQTRKERERAERERLIVTAARELAETEGWDAVTTRRLAERVEYSQPVLYSHFKGKDAIMAAVAVEGFADLAAELRAARTAAAGPRQAMADVAAAYADFAERRPALYDAMFSHSVDLPFATEAPPPLQAGFGELRAAIRTTQAAAEAAGPEEAGAALLDDELGLLTEVFWSGLHGLVTLTRGGRLPRAGHARRLALLVDRFTG
jgi:AcrR family transcriptional regulator